MNNKSSIYKLLLIIYLVLINTFCFGQVKELDIYNEWFSEDCSYKAERPFFVIRDSFTFSEFWKKVNLGGTSPYFDFNKYMVFVWAPGYTRKDYSRVEFERLVYKNGSLLVLMDFGESDKTHGLKKNPVKFAIFPIMNNCDIFIFKKVKVAWKTYDWQPIYSLWDMSGERKTPLKIVLMDKEEAPKIVLATGSVNIVSKNDDKEVFETAQQPQTQKRSEVKPITIVQATPMPKQEQKTYVAKTTSPVATPITASGNSSMQSRNVSQQTIRNDRPPQTQSNLSKQNNQTPKSTGVVSNAPIEIGGATAEKSTNTSSFSSSSQPEVAPGMAEDPLFGAEFDITF